MSISATTSVPSAITSSAGSKETREQVKDRLLKKLFQDIDSLAKHLEILETRDEDFSRETHLANLTIKHKIATTEGELATVREELVRAQAVLNETPPLLNRQDTRLRN